jgi:uncharacterized protein (UPF0333 family)
MQIRDAMHSRGQISIEYLIVLASFFAMLCVVVPMAAYLYQLSSFAIDVQNAKSFSSRVSFAADNFQNYSAGSKLNFDFKSENNCEFSAFGNKISFEISNPAIKKSESLEGFSEIPFKQPYNYDCKSISFAIIKENDGLIINKH